MKTRVNKKDTVRYLMFAFSFLAVLVLTMGLVMILDTYSKKYSDNDINEIQGNSPYIHQENNLEINADDYNETNRNVVVIEIE
ncbi:MAG: hypothetical protein E7509_05155 [Ruminococcus sp.]|nr:hypothetical protein [Ruminococcus sp.]